MGTNNRLDFLSRSSRRRQQPTGSRPSWQDRHCEWLSRSRSTARAFLAAGPSRLGEPPTRITVSIKDSSGKTCAPSRLGAHAAGLVNVVRGTAVIGQRPHAAGWQLHRVRSDSAQLVRAPLDASTQTTGILTSVNYATVTRKLRFRGPPRMASAPARRICSAQRHASNRALLTEAKMSYSQTMYTGVSDSTPTGARRRRRHISPRTPLASGPAGDLRRHAGHACLRRRMPGRAVMSRQQRLHSGSLSNTGVSTDIGHVRRRLLRRRRYRSTALRHFYSATARWKIDRQLRHHEPDGMNWRLHGAGERQGSPPRERPAVLRSACQPQLTAT